MSLEVCIKKKFKGFALNVSFKTDNGCLGILGASGSGKSMTLKCIAGVETPDKGRIVINGRVLFDSAARINLSPQRRRIGYLFQDYALFPNMTVYENISCGLKLPRAERGQKTKAMMERFKLEGLENQYPSQLSGGQKQRTALARMLVCEPEAILLDEPFSALDTYLREQMQMELSEILKGYNDAVMVTHSQDEAFKLCGELMVIADGAAAAKGETAGMFHDPRELSVARLTGCGNISRAQRTGEMEVAALDWGLVLQTGKPVPEDTGYVGIRAQDFLPASGRDANIKNLIKIKILKQLEGPFEWNIDFVNAGSESLASNGRMRWNVNKRLLDRFPEYLSVAPESLLLLTGDPGIKDLYL